MSRQDNQMREAVESLWTEVFGAAPPIRCEPHLLTEALLRNLASAPPYGDPAAQRDRQPLAPHRIPHVTDPR